MKIKITALMCILSLFIHAAYAAPVKYGDREANPNLVLPENPKLKMADGNLCVEAEDMPLSKDMTVIADSEASGGQAVKVTASKWAGTLDMVSEERSFYVETTADKSGSYAAWLRVKTPNIDSNSIWSAFNSEAYNLYEYQPEGTVYEIDNEYHWISAGHATLAAGESFHISFKYREMNFIVDRLIITSNLTFEPQGKEDVPGAAEATDGLYPEPEIKPIAQHPRLLVTKDMIPALKNNMQTVELSTAYKIAEAYAGEDLSSAVAAAAGGYNTALETKIEARALMYLIGEHNEKQARQTIDYARTYLAAVNYKSSVQDITREVGYAMMMGAVVYDWCYELLTEDDKEFFTSRFKVLASMKEIGYPPVKLSSIGSHAGEYEIMRDMLSVGIAVYDEDPEIYNLAAGRFFSEYVESRKMFNKSGNHPQGISYGAFRFECELWAELIFERMGYKNVLGEGIEDVAYKWIYERLPFGAWFKDGDDTAISKYSYHNYSLYDIRTQILCGNMFNDPVLKRQYLKELSVYEYNPSFFWLLVIADPSIAAEEVNELPLARETNYPLSGVVARTSWQTGLDAPTAMAQMKIQEKNLADHMHLDSGTFQIYYKGSLAVASGLYEGKDGQWGSSHYYNYYKRTISHNAVTVLDPDEKVYPMPPSSNDGGQKQVAASVVKTYAELMDIGDLAQTKGSYIGPNEYTPKFSYIKGDITNAYSDKIGSYSRSMVFMDLFDDDYPAAFVVFDKVDSKDAAFKKTWLMHSIEEPEINGNITTICRTEDGFNGKLVNKTMLPSKHEITKLNGFVVNGSQYPNGEYDGIDSEGAEWRIEVTPKQQQKEDTFLNAMYVTDADADLPVLEMQQLQNGVMTGAAVKDRIVMFSNDTKPVHNTFTLNIPDNGYETVSCMLADIEPGKWKISGDDNDTVVEVTEKEGVIYFEGRAGSYRISPAEDEAEAEKISYPRQPKVPLGDFLIYQDGLFLNQPKPTKVIDSVPYTSIRSLVDAYGAKIDWNPDNGEVTLINEFGKSMVFKNGQTECVIDGEAASLAHQPQLFDDSTYVCLSDLDDFLMIKSRYDSYAKILKVSIIDRETVKILEGLETYTPVAAAASENDGNLPENAMDMDFETRWSAEGDFQWIMLDLGEEKEVGQILLATYRGSARALAFSVELSSDGKNFKEVYRGSVSGTTDGLEKFPFEASSARYVRLNCYANNKDKWNSVTELIAAK